jgi:N-acetylglutamate synthase-like GNAT family acetyltransferase
MKIAHRPHTAEDWLRHLFDAKAAKDGGVVRRNARDMERMVGRSRFMAEMQRRGFTVAENAGQVIVFCNAEPVRIMARGATNFP